MTNEVDYTPPKGGWIKKKLLLMGCSRFDEAKERELCQKKRTRTIRSRRINVSKPHP